MKYLLTFSFVLLMTLSTYAQDVVSNTEGVTISATLDYARWSSSDLGQLDEQEPNGAGLGLRVGYGFNQRFELFARLKGYSFALNDPEAWDRYSMASLAGGLRLNLGGTLQRLRPFVEAAYSSQYFIIGPITLNNGDPNIYELKMRGPALQVAGGLNFFITKSLAFNASVGGSFGRASSFLLNDNGGFDDRPDLRTLQGNAGLTFFIH